MNSPDQTTAHILMVRPSQFGFNQQTAANNAFQQNNDRYSPEEIKELAVKEFDGFVDKLRAKDIMVIVVQDPESPAKPDAVFPNNWVTFHRDGSVVTYPIFAPLRRNERRQEVMDEVGKKYRIARQYRLEKYESEGLFLEGTGSMILDRVNRIVYACLGPRTDEIVLDKFCELKNYQKLQFRAVDSSGVDIYHTNVMMALGEDFVVICMESIPDEYDRERLRESFQNTGKEVIDISLAQMIAYAGNMLQLRNKTGETFLVMSEQAFQSLKKDQIVRIERHTQILHSPIWVIETYGGGSARCMIAEIFLQPIR